MENWVVNVLFLLPGKAAKVSKKIVEKLPTETVPETLAPTETPEKEPVKVHSLGKVADWEGIRELSKTFCLSGPFFLLWHF